MTSSKGFNIINNDELRIVLVGKTGTGKSATGNTILGKGHFVSKFGAKSMTVDCAKGRAIVDGEQVAVIDTPGLFDTRFDVERTTKDLTQCILFASPGPHIFLVVVRLGRFTEEEKMTVQKIQEIFGQTANRYSMVLFTGGDLLDDTTIEDFLLESEDLQELVARCNGEYHVFNNKLKDRTQVSELLLKIRNIIKKNGGSHYTNEMFQEAERAIEEEKQRILKEKEEQMRKEKEEMEREIQEKYEREMEKLNKQMEAERERVRREQEEAAKKLREMDEERRKERMRLEEEMRREIEKREKKMEKIKTQMKEEQERIRRENEQRLREEHARNAQAMQQMLRERENREKEMELKIIQIKEQQERIRRENEQMLREEQARNAQAMQQMLRERENREREMEQKFIQMKEEQERKRREEAARIQEEQARKARELAERQAKSKSFCAIL